MEVLSASMFNRCNESWIFSDIPYRHQSHYPLEGCFVQENTQVEKQRTQDQASGPQAPNPQRVFRT
eukprot:4538655-Amphidinium_carterae.1